MTFLYVGHMPTYVPIYSLCMQSLNPACFLHALYALSKEKICEFITRYGKFRLALNTLHELFGLPKTMYTKLQQNFKPACFSSLAGGGHKSELIKYKKCQVPGTMNMNQNCEGRPTRTTAPLIRSRVFTEQIRLQNEARRERMTLPRNPTFHRQGSHRVFTKSKKLENDRKREALRIIEKRNAQTASAERKLFHRFNQTRTTIGCTRKKKERVFFNSCKWLFDHSTRVLVQ